MSTALFMLLFLGCSSSGTSLGIGGLRRLFSFTSKPPSARIATSSIQVGFNITNWDAAQPIMQEFVNLAEHDSDVTPIGWTTSPGASEHGATAVFSSYLTTDASICDAELISYLNELAPLVDAMLVGPATMDRLDVQAPRTLHRRSRWAESTHFAEEEMSHSLLKAMPQHIRSATCIEVVSTFTISDWVKTRQIMKAIIEETEATQGCLYFAWHRDGDQLLSRGLFADAKALKAHLEQSRKLGATLQGPAQLESVHIHGPKLELTKLEEATAHLLPVFFETCT